MKFVEKLPFITSEDVCSVAGFTNLESDSGFVKMKYIKTRKEAQIVSWNNTAAIMGGVIN